MAGGVKGFDGQHGERSIYGFDPRKIIIDKGHNPRSPEELRRNIDKIKPQILASGGVLKPLWVRTEGKQCILVDGETRLISVLELIQEGKFTDDTFGKHGVTVPVQVMASAADPATRIHLSIQANEGTPLKDWEIGAAYAKLLDLYWTVEDIAEKSGKTTRYINHCIELFQAPKEAKEMLSQGLATPAAVKREVKKHGSKAAAVLKKKSDDKGGGKVSRDRSNPFIPLKKAVLAVLGEASQQKDVMVIEIHRDNIRALREAMKQFDKK